MHQPFPPISANDLQVRLADSTAEITASQKLRYRIFCGEMGGKASPEIQKQERDFDEFDAYCDHLLVLDTSRLGDDAVVGTYRLLRRSVMEAGPGKFYSESEYNVDAVKEEPGEILELGRSCVDADYRSRAVMQLLWRGIGSYIFAHDIKLMFGCASFTGDDPQKHAMALSYLYYNHLTPKERCPIALPDLYMKMDMIPQNQVDMREALNQMPALIKGYLRLNGTIGDGAVLDHAYNTTDVGIVVQTDLVAEKYGQKYGTTDGGQS